MKKFILIIICSMFLVNIVIFGIYYIDKKSNVEEIGEFYISNKFSQISGEKQEGNLLFNLKENVVTCESENNVETNETIEENKKQVTNNVPVNKTSNNVTNYKVSYEKYNSKYSFFSNDENISAENMKLAESEIDKLPQKVINAFSKYNWEICITNDNISDKYFNGSYGYVNAVTATDYSL